MTEAPVEIHADGACKGNPGPGGWGVLLLADGRERELCGGEAATTNNRMELTAVIRGLEALAPRSRVQVFTDSQYVQKGITEAQLVSIPEAGHMVIVEKTAAVVEAISSLG